MRYFDSDEQATASKALETLEELKMLPEVIDTDLLSKTSLTELT
jgi:hypothetical protein